MEPLCQIIGFNPIRLSKEELMLLEASFLMEICNELREQFKTQYSFYLIKYDSEMENFMVDHMLIRCIIKEILLTGEYNVPGIAYYTQIPEDVIYDAAVGANINPSITFFTKIIELHKSIKPDLYRKIFKKIIETNYDIL